MTFISRFFDFRIIREVLNLRASIPVVSHFRELKVGMDCSFPKFVVHRIAVNFLSADFNCHNYIIVSLNTRSKSLVHI